MAFIFPANFFHYGLSRYSIVSRDWKNICDWYTRPFNNTLKNICDWYTRPFDNTLNIPQWYVLYFFGCEKKNKLVECILMWIFNIGISIAAIDDIFDINELAEFTGGS